MATAFAADHVRRPGRCLAGALLALHRLPGHRPATALARDDQAQLAAAAIRPSSAGPALSGPCREPGPASAGRSADIYRCLALALDNGRLGHTASIA